MSDSRSFPIVQWYSLYMASVEMTLGSFLHALHIPLTGYILSLHQAFCLTRACKQSSNLLTASHISTHVALLKSLSPAGKKITPMLAIMVQGCLFNLGILCLGNNKAGHLLGAILLSFWGFLQPVLFAMLIFRQDLWIGLSSLQEALDIYAYGISLYFIVFMILLLKATLSVCASTLAYTSVTIEPWLEQKIKWAQKRLPQGHKKSKPILTSLLKDLTNLWFLIPLIGVSLYSFYNAAPLHTYFWLIISYLAQALFLILVLRFLPSHLIFNLLEKRKSKGIAYDPNWCK